MRSYAQAKAFAEYQRLHPADYVRAGGHCQQFARNCVGAAGWANTALQAWYAIPASHRHGGTPRAGSLPYFDDPRRSGEAGHVGFAIENGKMYQTDALGQGRVWITDYLWPVRNWGMRYLGWIDWTPSGAINLKPLVAPAPVPSAPWTNPAYPRPNNAVPRFPGVASFGPGKTNDQVLLWAARMVLLGYLRVGQLTHSWSSTLQGATAAFQRSQGWSGSGADGIPGPTTWDAAWKRAVPGHAWPRTLTPQGDFSLLAGSALVAIGYGGLYRVGPSRAWGAVDHNALVAFQRAHGLPATGQTDSTTWTRLGLS